MSTSQPPPPQSPTRLNLVSILSSTKSIINSHSRHFLTLSTLFLLPLSFSSTTLLPALLASSSAAADHTSAISLSFSAVAFLLSLLAAAAITSAVLRAFFGRHVSLLSAAQSTAAAFLPLLATSLAAFLFFVLIAAAFSLLLFLAAVSAILLGFHIDYSSSPYFLAAAGALSLILLLALAFLHVNWTLAPPIVLAESVWGLAALRRSAGLVRGMRGVAASLLVFVWLSAGVLSWISAYSAVRLAAGGGSGGAWRSAGYVVQIVVTSTFLTVVLLYGVAANAVLYMYCKAFHGELAAEIAEEFSAEYVCLPFDDRKVPHTVSVAYG